jgi:hypothetical protein
VVRVRGVAAFVVALGLLEVSLLPSVAAAHVLTPTDLPEPAPVPPMHAPWPPPRALGGHIEGRDLFDVPNGV